jgi:quercetin dioxygenase-like cupin family protein
MNIEPARPTIKNPPEQFAGDVWVDPIAAPHEPDQRMTVALVRFAPGARTAWHCHARGQYLRITRGTARFGTRNGQVIEVHPGQTQYTPPGQDHWHAATPDSFMEDLPMFEAGDDPASSTIWKEHITAADYTGNMPKPGTSMTRQLHPRRSTGDTTQAPASRNPRKEPP